MSADLIVHDIGQLITPHEAATLLKGKSMDRANVFEKAFIAVKDGRILDYGSHDYKRYLAPHTECVDAGGRLVTPGLIDGHTHVVHGGSRENEFEMKRRGMSYIDILKAGGGILSTVASTREMSEAALMRQAGKSLDIMLAHGVTTVEGKSGYGLEPETEIKQLRVQKQLSKTHVVDVVPTYMGAHAVPSEFKDDRKTFLDEMLSILPFIHREGLAEYVDVFCEDGAFTLEESAHVLETAKKEGLGLKIHADEMVALGGVELAVSLGASSADHLMAITDHGIAALAGSDVVANVLPSTSFNLGQAYAPVRKMIDAGVAVALSSDYNPGSAPSENLLFSLNLGAIHMKMTPEEVLNAATANPAYALKRHQEIGRIAKGYRADFVIYDAVNWPYVLYHYAVNHVSDVFKDGRHVIRDKQPIWR